MKQSKVVVETASNNGFRADMSDDMPYLFLFQGMGSDDPELIELGVACKEWVRTAQISYPPWRVLLHSSDFDFATLVNDVIAQIEMHSPAGPILFAGYSWGGNIAFVVAAHLEELGRSVHFLGLLDSEARLGFDYATNTLRPSKTRRQQLIRFMAAMRRGNSTEKITYKIAEQLVQSWCRPLLLLYARIPQSWLSGKFVNYLERDLQSFHFGPLQYQWAVLRKTLPPLHASVFLFRTAQHDRHSTNSPHHLGWEPCCLNLTVLSTPGTHNGNHSMLGPSNLPILCVSFRKMVLQTLVS